MASIEDFINANVEYSGNYDMYITREEVNTIADSKQDVLDLYTTLYGIGKYVTELNYNNITLNKPDLSVYATNTNLKTQLATKQNTLTASTSLVGNGSAITSLDYNNMTLNKPLTNSGTNIYFNNSGNVGINLTAPQQKLDVNGIISIDNANSTKLIFAFDTNNGYRHSILTNHDNGITDNNTIDFYVWRYGQTASTLGDKLLTRFSSKGTLFYGNRYVYINDIINDRNTYDHTTAPLSIFNQTPTSTSALNDPLPVLNMGRQGTSAQAYGARATFKLCRFENNSTNSRTRLDIDLSHTTYNDVNVMTIRSDGRVGINRNTPGYTLDVNGQVNATNFYVNGTNISSVYLTVVGASFTYATISSLSSYLTTASASSTYATISSLSSYLTTASASSTYATITQLNTKEGLLNNNTSNIFINSVNTNSITLSSNNLFTYTLTQFNDVYPPKVYNSFTTLQNMLLGGISLFRSILTFNTVGIVARVAGDYEIYCSTWRGNGYEPYLAWNFRTTIADGAWESSITNAFSQYNSSTGNYSGANYIRSDYLGEFLIVKLVRPIVIANYQIYIDTNELNKAPKNFRIYGSSDAINWTILQTITNATYSSGVYTNTSFTASSIGYLYFGIVINAITGSGFTNTKIVEWRIEGKQLNIKYLYNCDYVNIDNKPDISLYFTKLETSNIFPTYSASSNIFTTSNVSSNNLYITSNNLINHISYTSNNLIYYTSNEIFITSNKLVDYNNLINKPTNLTGDWNTLINKPTNFQADWNSTIINKPTNFQADWNSTIINKPTIVNSQWTTNGTNIYYNTGNVGIGDNNPVSKLTIKSSYNVVDSGLCINASDPNTYNLKWYPYVVGSGQVGYKIQINNQSTTTNDVLVFNHVGNVGIGQNPNANAKLDVQGRVNFHNGNPVAVPSNYMASGSLTIGGTNANYGGGSGWSGNTAGLMFECQDNTEIAIHDSGHRVSSLIYFAGSGNYYHEYGRNMGWGHPNQHYFKCNSLFEIYVSGGTTNWNYFKLEPTSLWGDGTSTASEYGGTKYLTIRNMMFQSPHIVPTSVGNKAYIRYGRAGGIQSGTWWETACRTDGKFHITKEGSDTTNGIFIDTGGKVGINRTTPSTELDVNGEISCIGLYAGGDDITGVNNLTCTTLTTTNFNATSSFTIKGTSENANAILYLSTPFNSTSPAKCAIIAKGQGYYSTSKLLFCLDASADNNAAYVADELDNCFTITKEGNIGIGNDNPINNATFATFNLCIGDSSITNNEGALIIEKRNTGGGTRNFRTAFNNSFYYVMGDYGANNSAGSWLEAFGIAYTTPSNCLSTNGNGNIYSGTGNFFGVSDVFSKTDIETIEDALWKVEQLRGVNYTDIISDERRTGLIAQEVINIIPEAVSVVKEDKLGISYGNMVGVLVEAIKELSTKIKNLENIIERNNLK